MTSNTHTATPRPDSEVTAKRDVSPLIVIGLGFAVLLWPIALPLIAAYLAVQDALGQ